MPYDQMELAWAAGIFDGEGTSGWHGGSIRMGVKQKGTELLERFQAAVGVGNITRDSSKDDMYQWTAYGQNALLVYALLCDYLCTPKREQFKRALDRFLDRPYATVGKGGRPQYIHRIPKVVA